MNQFRRQPRVWLAFLFAISILSCAPAVPLEPDRLRTTLPLEPSTLNPLYATDGYTMAVAGYVFESLIQWDVKTETYAPRLALRWEILPDQKTYRFYLRPGVLWQNGEPFTADDVVATVAALQDERVSPHWKSLAHRIERVDKRDALTVDIVYAEIDSRGVMACGSLLILPQTALKAFAEHPTDLFRRDAIGTGPYALSEWEAGERLVLRRHETYWGQKSGIRILELRLVADSTLAFQRLKKGDLDLIDDAREIQWARQTDSKQFGARFNKKSFLSNAYGYIGWNNANPLFADARVRRAMTELLNANLILQKLKYGLGKPATGPFHPASADFNPAVQALPYDPEHARALLAESGWSDHDHDGWLDKDGQRFSFTLLINDLPSLERLATIYQEDLRSNGIELKLQKLESGTLIARAYKKDFDAIALRWGFGYDSDLTPIWHSTGSYNFVSYANPRVDQILEALPREFSVEARHALNREMQALIYADQPYTFLFIDETLMFIAKRFQNVIIYPRAYDIQDWRVDS